jgi:hypothetical protein
MTPEEVKSAMKIMAQIDGLDKGLVCYYLTMLFLVPVGQSRMTLERAVEAFEDPQPWIEAGLACKNDEDVAPVAISTFFNQGGE